MAWPRGRKLSLRHRQRVAAAHRARARAKRAEQLAREQEAQNTNAKDTQPNADDASPEVRRG